MKFGAALLLPVKHPEPAEDNVLLVEVEVIVQRAVIVATVVRDSGAPFNTDSFEVNELLRIGAAACPRRRHDKSVRAPEWSGTLQVARIASRRASFPTCSACGQRGRNKRRDANIHEQNRHVHGTWSGRIAVRRMYSYRRPSSAVQQAFCEAPAKRRGGGDRYQLSIINIINIKKS